MAPKLAPANPRQSPAHRAKLRGDVEAITAAQRFKPRPALRRRELTRDPETTPLIAYDLETDPIAPGDPAPLWITAYAPGKMYFEHVIDGFDHLGELLRQYFLIDDFLGHRFVAWNGNRFDAYFIARALLHCADFVLIPYMTQNKALRGLRVMRREDLGNRKAKGWEFLDGIAMLGLQGTSLEKFLATFAPDWRKLTDAIDFEGGELFDWRNQRHRQYAMRDSMGLWHGMTRAEAILMEHFEQPLGVTMGGACIRIFQRNIPEGVEVDPLIPTVHQIVNDFVMRGGYCYCMRRYVGPVWKYDLNQAYAAAMREAQLPAGGMLKGQGVPPARYPCFIARVRATHESNVIPFYYRTLQGGRIRSVFSTREITDTWLTSIEVLQLLREGWKLTIAEYYVWASSFQMREFVDRLERLRTTCEGGPSGAIGTMVKATGNHSFGKTAETVVPETYALAAERPDDEWFEFFDDDDQRVDYVWFKPDPDRRAKAYHQPQLASFITAHVRMVVRRAALLAPAGFLYADTDCVIFDRDVTDQLDVDPKRYGAWKVEESGTDYRIIAKKVYQSTDDKKRSAKGMNVKRLTADDFVRWFDGAPPQQEQVQIQNFLVVAQGGQMYRKQARSGTAIPD